jgi:hypothetical protein
MYPSFADTSFARGSIHVGPYGTESGDGRDMGR